MVNCHLLSNQVRLDCAHAGVRAASGCTAGWSELAPTNAPVADEPVEAVFRMNENPILLTRIFFFHLFSTPKFSPLLPPPSYLPSTSPLLPTTYPPPYLPPTSPLLPTTYQPLPPSLHRQSSRNVEREPAWSWSRSYWSRSLELPKLGAWNCAWSRSRTHAL